MGETVVDTKPDLRERRRRETRLDINWAALDLFERRGVASTTVDEIARAAGISASTFFRHFKTKEESILLVDFDVESEIERWLDATAPEEIDLSGIEVIYERAVRRLVEAPEDIQARVLRGRRLINADPHLRSVAIGLDATALCRLTDAVLARQDGRRSEAHARLLVEGAGMTLRVAFDDWATRVDNGEDADLADIYRRTREELRRVVR